jgi:hypothetical protein
MSGLLKLVELVEKLQAAQKLEQEEGVKCLKESSPPPLSSEMPLLWTKLPLVHRQQIT